MLNSVDSISHMLTWVAWVHKILAWVEILPCVVLQKNRVDWDFGVSQKKWRWFKCLAIQSYFNRKRFIFYRMRFKYTNQNQFCFPSLFVNCGYLFCLTCKTMEIIIKERREKRGKNKTKIISNHKTKRKPYPITKQNKNHIQSQNETKIISNHKTKRKPYPVTKQNKNHIQSQNETKIIFSHKTKRKPYPVTKNNLVWGHAFMTSAKKNFAQHTFTSPSFVKGYRTFSVNITELEIN